MASVIDAENHHKYPRRSDNAAVRRIATSRIGEPSPLDSVKRTLRPSSDNQSYTTQGGLNRFSIWRNRFIGGKAEWAVTVERLVSMYQAIGVSSVHLLDLVVTELSPRLAQVFVRWALNDGSSTMLYAFEAV